MEDGSIASLKIKFEADAEQFKQGINEILEMTNKMKSQLEQVSNSTKLNPLGDTSQISSSISNIEKQMTDFLSKIVDEEGNLKFDGLKNELDSLRESIRKTKDSEEDDEDPEEGFFGKLARIVTAPIKGLAKLGSALGKAGKSLFDFYKNAKSNALEKLSSSVKKFSSGLKGGFKNILRYAFGIRSIFILVRKLQTAFKEGIKNLVGYSSEMNKSISSMKSSLDTLKNAIAVAFAPIVNIVAPYISQFIDLLTSAANAIGRFFAALTGKSFAVQAKKNMQDYAKSVGSAEKAAKKALLPIDEINNLSSDSGSSGGGGGEISTDDMFETVQVESSVSEFAEKVKQAWANADFTEIGTIVSNKIGNALDSIPWETKVKPMVEKIGLSIGTFLNGMTFDLSFADSLGTAIGEIVNTIVIGINSLYTSVDFTQLGVFFATGFQSIFDTIDIEALGTSISNIINGFWNTVVGFVSTLDWATLGMQFAMGLNVAVTNFDAGQAATGLSEAIVGALTFAVAAIQTFDWGQLGVKVAEFIGSIDWGGVVSALSAGLGAALAGLAEFIGGLIGTAWDSVVNWWSGIMEESGGNLIDGLFLGIVDIIANIGIWLWDNVVQPFIDGFKGLFGIHSPSTVMEEMGGFIMEGLLNGIVALKDSIISFFTGFFDDVVAGFLIFIDNVKNFVMGIVTWIVEKVVGFKDSIVEKFESLKTGIGNIINGVKTTFMNIVNYIKNSFVNGFKTALDKIKNFFKTTFETIKNLVKVPLNAIINIANKAIDGLNSIKVDVPSWVPFVGGKTFGFNLAHLPTLANGGLAYGETQAIVGEYAGASVNPEIIAPLDKLNGIMAKSMEDAFISANLLNQNNNDDNKTYVIQMTMDGKIVSQKVIHDIKQYEANTGKTVFSY